MKPSDPPETDWNFDPVPANELAACCYWEYARESEFIRSVWQRSVQAAEHHLPSPDRMEFVGRDFMRMFNTLGRAAIMFQHGIYGFGGDTHYKGFISPFPQPWRSLSPEQRRILIETAAWDADGWCGIPGFRRGHCADVAALEKLFKPKSLPEVFGGDGRIAIDKFFHSGSKLRQISPNYFSSDGTETLVVEIDWGKLTNEELIEEFRIWLKENEPKSVQRPDKRGHKPGDWRAHLTRLAVMRLLARFTALQLVDGPPAKLPAIWATKQFAARKWADVTKWHDARREARKCFHTLFPFLPAEANPLSWERQRPAK